MADLIKKIKIKKQDGTFTDYIPIGAEAQNISMDNGKSVQYNIGDIDVENDGNINEQLKNITTTIDALHYNNENQEIVLYCFFNENDNNSIHFYISYDTYNLIEIEPETRLYGRDPSIMYYKGKFYLTMTSYTNTRDFVVYESEDLSTWKQYDINIGLYNATYPKRWAPQWFVDTNDKVYIFLSVEYADTEGWGDFRIWRTECTDIKNMTFGTAVKMNLLNQPNDNHIDATVIKENNIYYMFVKSDHSGEKNIEKYSSTNFIDWNFLETDPGNLGKFIEGQFLFKFNNEWHLAGEKYATRDDPASYYFMKKTSDFINWSSDIRVFVNYEDISHGDGITVSQKIINKLLNSNKIKNIIIKGNNLYNFNNSIANPNYHLIAGGVTIEDEFDNPHFGRYLKLFSIQGTMNYRVFHGIFHISDIQQGTINSLLYVNVWFQGQHAVNSNLSQIAEIRMMNTDYQKCSTIAGRIVWKVNEQDNTMLDVYLDMEDNIFAKNHSIAATLVSSHSGGAKVVYYHEIFVDEVTGISLVKNGFNHARSLAQETKAIQIDNGTRSSCTWKCCMVNGNIKIWGHASGVNNTLIDCEILIENGDMYFINRANTYPNMNATIDNYDTDTKEYTITLSNIPDHSALALELSGLNRNFFTDFYYNENN